LTAHVLKRQFMAPGGPVFALMSFAPAGDSWWKATTHGGDCCSQYFTGVLSFLLLHMQSFCGSGFQPRKVWGETH